MKPTSVDIDLQDLTTLQQDTIPAMSSLRRGGEPIRLTPQEFTLVSVLARHYRKHSGQRMDFEQFVANDMYARIVLQESLNSGNPELAATARQFLDENGQPRFQLGKGSAGIDHEF
jgi:hypothetical protein